MTDDPHNQQTPRPETWLSVERAPTAVPLSAAAPVAVFHPSRREWLALAIASLSGWGCSRWSPNTPHQKSPWELQTPQMAPDTVVLEVALVRLLGIPGVSSNSHSAITTAPDTNVPDSTPVVAPASASATTRQAFKPPSASEPDSAATPANTAESAANSSAVKEALAQGTLVEPSHARDSNFVDTSPTPRFDDDDSTGSSASPSARQPSAADSEGSPSAPQRVAISAEVNSADFWQLVDEQALPLETRRRLEQNGLRAGVISGRPTPALQAALDAHTTRHQDLADTPDSTAPTGIQRIQNRAGKRGKILVSEQRDQLVVLLPEHGRLRGRTYTEAQCVISVRSFPQGDGQVELDLLPEIEHGQARQRWLGESTEGSFRIDSSRERVQLTQIRLTPRLNPGQMVVIGPILPLKGLGRQFFGANNQESPEVRVLVIRVAQTQYDDLFAPERTTNSLVTAPS